LFNKSELFIDTPAPIFVVEGVFDALALYPHAVAVLGKPTTAQENIIAKTKRPICVALDGDAWQEGWAFAMRLRVRGRTAHPLKLPPCEDPATLGLAWLKEAYALHITTDVNGDC
jgi:DNA primase